MDRHAAIFLYSKRKKRKPQHHRPNFQGETEMKTIATFTKWLLAVVGITVVGAGVAGFVLARQLPQLTVHNQCDEVIQLPTAVEMVPGVSAEIPVNGQATFPVIFGSGNYRLFETSGNVQLQLPRSIPTVGDTLFLYTSTQAPQARFQGQSVTVPMQQTVTMNQTYTLEVCS